MTSERAILILEAYKQRLVNSVSIGLEKDIEAYDMAIRALKNEQTDGDLISRENAIELVNYALAENKDVLEVLENMPSAEKIDSFIPQEDVADILNIVESALKGTNYEVVGYDNTDGFLKVLIDMK